MMVSPCFWQIFPTGCSMIFEGLPCPVDRSWCAQRCCDGAATESLLRRSHCCDGVAAATASLLRRSRCCDGAAQTSSVALILRVTSATELMLLRRIGCCAPRCCDGAATESLLRLSRCCDGAAQTSSVALILRVASLGRDAQNEASIHFPRVDLNFMVVAHSPRPPPWPRN